MSDIPAVRTRGLVKRFGTRTALGGLDLEVPPGAVFGLIGPNGAGKSTTLRILLDVLRPSAGQVEVLGRPPRRGGAAQRRRIGYLPGEVVLPAGTGRSVLEHLASLDGRAGSSASRARIADLAERLDLDPSRKIRTLSKGNKQKVAIVQAFAGRPELLVLDEPTSGLDPLVQQTFLDLVREARDDGRTVLLSSHVLSEIQHVADTAAVLNHGELVRVSSIDELRRTAVRTVTARITGASPQEISRALAEHAPLAGLTVTRPEDSTLPPGSDTAVVDVTGPVEGHADELVKTLSRFRVVELEIEAQDLEESVLAMYRKGN